MLVEMDTLIRHGFIQCCGSGSESVGSVCFWLPGSGSGSISQRYGPGSGSGSLYHQAKIVKKTLIPTALWLLFDFLSLKNDDPDPLVRRHGSTDPYPDSDLHQDVMDPQHWFYPMLWIRIRIQEVTNDSEKQIKSEGISCFKMRDVLF